MSSRILYEICNPDYTGTYILTVAEFITYIFDSVHFKRGILNSDYETGWYPLRQFTNKNDALLNIKSKNEYIKNACKYILKGKVQFNNCTILIKDIKEMIK